MFLGVKTIRKIMIRVGVMENQNLALTGMLLLNLDNLIIILNLYLCNIASIAYI